MPLFRKLWIRARPYSYFFFFFFFFSLGGASAGRFELCLRLATGPAVWQLACEPGGWEKASEQTLDHIDAAPTDPARLHQGCQDSG